MPPPHPAEPLGPLLHDRFLAAARRHPAGIALEVPAGPGRAAVALRYDALAGWAYAIAARLRGRIGRDDRVALLLERDDPALVAAQLGVLLAGGAFVGLDPAAPEAHRSALLDDAAPVAVVARPSRAVEAGGRPVVDPGGPGDSAPISTAAGASGPPTAAAVAPPDGTTTAARSDDTALAYVVYTSGTTGRPKGVAVEHRSIVALVDGDRAAFGLGPGDRVALCSSPAYDSSIEEAWLALASGATLVALDDATLRLGPDLPAWLHQHRITVLCPPPTLLRMMACPDPAAALQALRLLYVGGEPLPADLANRWSRGRRLVNGYGPTECTVTCTRADIVPGGAVTIGRPVPGSRGHVLAIGGAAVPDGGVPVGSARDADPSARPPTDDGPDEVPIGVDGELAIAGRAVARGYLGQPAQTALRFVDHPRFGRIYRTGDRVRRRPDGDLEHRGRLDAQVKVRGHRIELEAIEARLAALDGVRAAAATVEGDGPAAVLVAHVVPERPAAPPAARDLAAALAAELPAHMVPSRFRIANDLPTAIGGKLDRRALPPTLSAADARAAADAPRGVPAPAGAAARHDARAIAVAAAFEAALGVPVDDATADFFADLGGTSLTAVAVVVALRADADRLPAGAAALGVRDLYDAPTAAGLAARWRVRATEDGGDTGAPTPAAVDAAPSVTRFSVIQLGWLAAEVALLSAAAYAVAFVAAPRAVAAVGPMLALAGLPLLAAGLRALRLPLGLAWAVAVRRAVIGRYRPGHYPLWGSFHLAHWATARAARAVPWALVEGTALQAAALRALGARIGRDVHLGRGVDLAGGGWDVVAIGDGASLGRDARLEPVRFAADGITVAPVTVGAGATLAARAAVGAGGRLGDGAQLAALSVLADGGCVAPGRRAAGVLAVDVGLVGPPAPIDDRGGLAAPLHPAAYAAIVVGGRLAATALGWALPAGLLAAVVGALGLDAGALIGWLAAPRALPAAAGAAVLAGMAGVVGGLIGRAALLRLAGPVRAATVPVRSLAAVRAAAKARAVESAGRWLSGAMLWPVWLRAAGMRIGRGSEISTIHDTVPELVTIGAGSFFADGVYLAGPAVDRGRLVLAATRFGRDTFLGNHAVLAAGHDWPDGLFVGVATAPDARAVGPGSAWFGLPAMPLPRREVVAADRRLTHAPDALRWSTRAGWETLRLALPAGPIAAGALWLWAMAAAARGGPMVALAAAPLATLAAGGALVGAASGLKWALLGRVQPGRHAFWSGWCGRWDFVYMAWGAWARPVLARLEGTLALNACLRAFGLQLGRRVVLGPGFAQVVDPDMLSFGDDAVVLGHFQAHSFEDRILKIGRVTVGRSATVGADAVVLYDAHIGDGATVGPHGVVMKGERLRGGRRYDGAPVR